MTRWNVAAVVAVVVAMPPPAPACWRADCRAAARSCRKRRGAPTTTTTTTIPEIACPSMNCGGHCIMVNGEAYVSMFDALYGFCSFPTLPPDCDLCSEYCSSATTSTLAASTTTSTTAL
jgi:hypothetical protein